MASNITTPSYAGSGLSSSYGLLSSEPSLISSDSVSTRIFNRPIPEFYSGKCVLVAGPGFLGQVLVYKLLRSCPNIEKIYIYLNAHDEPSKDYARDKFLRDAKIFKISSIAPYFKSKVHFVYGEKLEMKPILQMSVEDRNCLRRVKIFFYTFGTLLFSRKPDLNYIYNCKLFMALLPFLINAEAIMYVSTSFSLVHYPLIGEKFYDRYYTAAIEGLDPATKKLSASRLYPYKNAHTLTKCWLEQQIKNRNIPNCRRNLPIGIFRPGMLCASLETPYPGYTDRKKSNTIIGIICQAMAGILRIVSGNPDAIANIVPVDMAANALIACAWDVSSNTTRRGENALIYNFSSAEYDDDDRSFKPNIITWRFIQDKIKNMIKDDHILIALCFCNFNIVKSRLRKRLWEFWDLTSFIEATRKARNRISKIEFRCNMIDARDFAKLIEHVTTNNWLYETKNVRNLWDNLREDDKLDFNFDIRSIDWIKYMDVAANSIRDRYFPPSESPVPHYRDRQKQSYILHVLSRTFIILIVISFITLFIYLHYSSYKGTYDIIHADELIYDPNIEL